MTAAPKSTQPPGDRMNRWAYISDCGRYRYWLGRRWDSAPLAAFVMLNPSTADANQDDPTIRRCMGFARRDGYGGIVVVNLFAWRATQPDALPLGAAAEGPENSEALRLVLCSDPRVGVRIAAWGAHPRAVCPDWVRSAVQLVCLGTSKSGAPRHPLYVKGDQQLVAW